MMERFSHIFAKYPYYIVGGVVVVVGLIYLMSRGGSTGGSTGGQIVSYGPSDTVVVAGAQTEMARINANANTAQAQYNSELQSKLAGIYADMNIDNNKTAVSIKSIDAGTSLAGFSAAKYINDSNNGAAVAMTQATVAGDVAMNKQSMDASIAAAQASANAAIQAAAFHASEVAAQIAQTEAQQQRDTAYQAAEVAAKVKSTEFLVQNGYAAPTYQ